MAIFLVENARIIWNAVFSEFRKKRMFCVMIFLRKVFKKNRFFIRKRHGAVVNLKPSPRWKKSILFLSGLLIGSIFLFAVDRIFTLAEVADFNPATCLGSWQNPENAQGGPENLDKQTESVSFTAENSATFVNIENQIFCGQFLPSDYNGEGEIKNVGLTLIWGAKNLDEPVIEETKPKFIEAIESTSTASSTAPADKPSERSESSTVSGVFRFPFTELAFAQDVGATTLPSVPSEPPKSDNPPTPIEISTPPAVDNTVILPAPISDSPKNENGVKSETEEVVPSKAADTKISEPEATTPTSSEVIGPAIVAPLELITSSSEAATVPEFIATSTVSTTPMDAIVPLPPDDNFLEVRYSFDGQTWLPLQKVGPNNFRNLTINLPSVTWEELRKIQIGVFGISNTLEKLPKIYLDGMLLEVQYDLAPILPETEKKIDKGPVSKVILPSGLPVIVLPDGQGPIAMPDGRENFKGDEPASFDFDLENIPVPTSAPDVQLNNSSGSVMTTGTVSLNDFPKRSRGFWGDMKATYEGVLSDLRRGRDFFTLGKIAKADSGGSAEGEILTPQNPMIAQVVDLRDRPTDFQPNLLVVNKKLRITFSEAGRNLKPGRYKLKLWILGEGAVYYSERSFLWGVVAINFNKSIYTVGDSARIGFGVLDGGGHTICDAAIDFKVTTPAGKTISLSTHNGSIERADSCAPQSVTNEPDYIATLPVLEAGSYQVTGSARIGHDSPMTVDEVFEAQEKPLFDVERFGPTRIYPPAIYQMRITIKANQDFSGVVSEYVPAVFEVIGGGIILNDNNLNTKTMQWRVEMKQGEAKELSYVFKAPDISPEFYRLGPAAFNSWVQSFTAGSSTPAEAISQNDIGGEVFREARSWQIAADAAGQMILLWDGTSGNIPSGWTCISCVAADPFFNVFPRASSTYGTASSSADTHEHTMTWTGTEAPDLLDTRTNIATPSTLTSDTHTHTWPNITATATSQVPVYLQLLFIEAATTTLPQGAIGMFSIASSALPANWSYYSEMQNKYLRGGSATSTGGSAQHGNIIPNTGSSSSTVTLKSGTFSASVSANHDHYVSGTLDMASNTPSFYTFTFAKVTAATTSVPNNLVAMFDNTSLPANWSIISSAGSSISGRLALGSSTAAGTGGATFHTHTSPGQVEGRVAKTSSKGAGGGKPGISFCDMDCYAAVTHSHVVYFNISSSTDNSMPIYRYVIFGEYSTTSPSPVISNFVLNGGNSIVLTDGTTTPITASFTVTDPQGCSDVFTSGGTTTTIYRSSVSGGSACAQNFLNCYRVVTTTNNCAGGNSAKATTTFDVYYFADATDGSSFYPNDTWKANVMVKDGSGATDATTTPTGVELFSLLAFSKSTTTFSYGTVLPSSTTGAVNQNLSFKNTGNVRETIGINATGTAMVSGSNSIATSSQCFNNNRRFSMDGGGWTACLNTANLTTLDLAPATAVSGTVGAWSNSTAINSASTIGMGETLSGDGSRIYLLGGMDQIDNRTSSVMTETFAGLSWSKIGALPTSTNYLGATTITGNGGFDYLYAVGGMVYGIPAVTTSTVWYASTTGASITTWMAANPLPSARGKMPVLNYNGYIYVVGGAIANGATATNTVNYASIDYNTGALGSWGTTTALPTGTYSHAGFALDNKIYILGGIPLTSTVRYASIASNGTLGTWTNTTALPAALRSHSVSVVNKTIYVAGGYYSGSASATSSVFYAPINSNGTVGNWELTTVLPWNRGDHFSAINADKLFIFGGEVGTISTVSTSSVLRSTITNASTALNTFWGFKVPNGTLSGTYNSSLNFTATIGCSIPPCGGG
ncbi:MAG: hypothetical protein WCX12_01545 [Candidatus Paceibacterota bacterium]|jgi:hypothetical protein